MDTIGIYKIENTVNGKVYIGQSRNIEDRWKNHIYHLNKGDAPNSYLQHSWEKYGAEAFAFSIVETCPQENLNDREIYWIDRYDSYRNGYNLTFGGGGSSGYKMTSEQIEKLRASLKGKPKPEGYGEKVGGRIKAWMQENGNPSSIAVVCLNSGVLYENSNVASQYTGVLSTSIRRCCNGILQSAGKDANGTKLVWLNADEYDKLTKEEIAKRISVANQPRTGSNGANPQAVVLLNTREVFGSIVDASKQYDVCPSSITTQCKRILTDGSGRNFAGVFPGTNTRLVWAYYDYYITMDDEQIQRYIDHANASALDARTSEGRKIVCLNNGVTYANTAEAGKALGIGRAVNIRRCISGELRSCGKSPSGEKYAWATLAEYQGMSREEISRRIEVANADDWHPTKVVICLNTGETFPSLKSAVEAYGLNINSLIACCKGKQTSAGKHPTTGENLIWKYLKDYEQSLPSDKIAVCS